MFSIKSTSSSRKLIFSEPRGECFRVTLEGDVSATIVVWAYQDAHVLKSLFQELGGFDKPWKGERKWESIEQEFSISVSCSPLGEVLFKIQMYSLGGISEEWSVIARVATEFGQLEKISKAAKTFFTPIC